MRALAIRMLYAVTVFLAAALVFLVQPMVAKQLLPVFGGTPGVWNTAVVFFQVVLLVGYGVAHVSLRVLGPRRHVAVQLGLGALAIAFLPFAVRTGETAPASVPPAAWLAVLLATSVAVPYLAVSTASPVLQRWFAELGDERSDDPYFLYVASNAGSLVGLLAFPFVLEPLLDTADQERIWTVGFAAWLLGIAGCAAVLWRRTRAGAVDEVLAAGDETAAAPVVPAPDITFGRGLRWVVVAAVPSALLLGVTTFITTDVASAPLLWVVPLALYLLSFMVTFGHRVRIGVDGAGLAAACAIVALLLVETGILHVEQLPRMTVHLVAMFTAAALCHAWLHRDRPPAGQLTNFYLLLSLGGAIGGAFTALVAPVAFDRVYEYPLLLAVVFVLRPPLIPRLRGAERSAWLRAGISIVELALAAVLVAVLADAASQGIDATGRFSSGLAVLAVVAGFGVLAIGRWGFVVTISCLLALLTLSDTEQTLLTGRNFFGTVRVVKQGRLHRLLYGTTLHGSQFRDARRDRMTTYYGEAGPLGDVFEQLQARRPFVNVGVVGLGTGTVIGYARLWQRFTFYEIDPAVVEIAKDPRLFTWLSDADVRWKVVEGDARLRLAEARPGTYDLLVLDAYSSDAVPLHLLTVEAMRMYERRLAEGGAIAMHISSRNLALEPVVSALARETGMAALIRVDAGGTRAHIEAGANGSVWVALAPDAKTLEPLERTEGWRELEPTKDEAWTDDRSDVAGAITWLPDWLP